jgi:hypothetical protein
MFKQNPNQQREMVPPSVRNEVIERIDAGELESETVTGYRQGWWKNKHHPKQDIPTKIYLLGNGSPEDLYGKYIAEHEYINHGEFLDYTRELIKQGIMI